MIVIDGAQGEGGGQVLRTALSLSLATGAPFRLENIRANRSRPGLLRQHLTAVRAAAAIGRARVEGDELASAALTFEPGRVHPGEYTFAVGSAGSVTLVFQMALVPLLLAGAPSTIHFEGGTHNPWAPPFDFLTRVFLPAVGRMGVSVDLALERHGFYPAGGGRFTATIRPAADLAPLDLCERGEIVARRVRALLANLPAHIGEREVKKALSMLNWDNGAGEVVTVSDAIGPGNVVLVEIESHNITEMFAGFGEVGVPAETVAAHAAQEARRYLAAGVPVGIRLADQLLPLMAAGRGGAFRTMSLSRHALTNIEIVRRFIDVRVGLSDEGHDMVSVTVEKP
jgi:RNA 3'-terminal phosphate cyclase (ATP)